MLSALVLVLVSLAHAECDADFHAKMAPADAPEHPPIDRLLEFAYDTDDSGHLDDSEAAKRDADMVLRCHALDDLVASLDADHDGVISDSERDTFHQLVGPPPHPSRRGHRGHPPRGHEHADRPPLPPPAMRAYDLDRDHSLSVIERDAARADIQDRLRNGLPPFPHPER